MNESNLFDSGIRNALRIPNIQLNPYCKPIKKSLVEESISWSCGPSTDNQSYHTLWNDEKYRVALGKPGKEVDIHTLKHKDGSLTNNANDMKPTIFMDGNVLLTDGSFTGIFEAFQKLGRSNETVLELLACLLFRNSYLQDHKLIEGRYIYSPSPIVVELIESYISSIYDISLMAFLHYLEAIARNEDTKYHTLGHDIDKGTGRTNNLLTCVNIIGVFLNRVSLVKFAGALTRPPTGIATISQKAARRAFPLLNG